MVIGTRKNKVWKEDCKCWGTILNIQEETSLRS